VFFKCILPLIEKQGARFIVVKETLPLLEMRFPVSDAYAGQISFVIKVMNGTGRFRSGSPGGEVVYTINEYVMRLPKFVTNIVCSGCGGQCGKKFPYGPGYRLKRSQPVS
jgi:hypothetical protein